jgi:putative ABC transport system substrate-binding protein
MNVCCQGRTDIAKATPKRRLAARLRPKHDHFSLAGLSRRARLPAAHKARSLSEKYLGGKMQRRELITLIGGAAALWPLTARAQTDRSRRIGVLMGYPEGDPQAQANVKAMRKGLQNLGWIDGQNVTIDYRWAGGDPDKARAFARELIGMAPDVIVPSTNQVTAILRQETASIPIVFVFVGDPVGSGFAASLAKPGGNLTGFANFENSTGGKWLELCSEVAPGVKRVGFVYHPDAAPNVGFYRAAEAAAPSLG